MGLIMMHAQVTELATKGQTPGGAGYHVNWDSDGQRLFVGCGTSIWIYDATDTNNIHVIAKRPLLGLVNETDLYGDILFAAATHDGVYAFDANSDTLTVIAHYIMEGDAGAYDMWRTNDTLFIADESIVRMLQFDPADGFSEITQFGGPNAISVASRNNHIAVGFRGIPSGGLRIYDKNNLETPIATWKNNNVWNLQDIQFADLNNDIIYVCGGAQNLLFTKSYFYAVQVLDSTIITLDSFSVNGILGLAQAAIVNMDSRNDTLFLATTAAFNSSLETIVPILDASGLPEDSLIDLGYVRPGLWHFDVALMDGTPYIAMSSEWFGVLISDISELQPDDTLGFLETGGWTQKCILKGDTIWACHRGYGLSAYPADSLYYSNGYLSDSEILHIFEQFVSDIAFLNDTLIVLNTMDVYNLAPWYDGGKPSKAWELDLGSIATVDYIETNTGPRLITGFSSLLPMPTALILCDPFDTTTIAPLIDSVQIKSDVFGFEVSGDTVFSGYRIENQPYLVCYKIEDDQFMLIDTIAVSGEINSIAVEGNKIAISCGLICGAAWFTIENGIFEHVGTIFDWHFNPVGLHLRNDLLYAAEKFYGMRIYDLATPEADLVAECKGTGGWFNLFGSTDVTVGTEGKIYLSDFQAGVIIVEPWDIILTVEDAAFENLTDNHLKIYPIPANDHITVKLNTQDKNERIHRINVYNSTGKIVADIAEVNNRMAFIDLEHYTNGIYFIRVYSESHKQYCNKIIVQH